MRIALIVGACLLMATPAEATTDKVQYGPVPEWVDPPPSPSTSAADGGALRIVYNDVQTRLDADGQHTYTAWRARLLAPEALPIGNLNLVWNPSGGSNVVHHLRVYRDGRMIDVLEDSGFSVFQREGGLEQAMLDGLLTANLQVPGLRVGDEIEFAATLSENDPVFGEIDFGALVLGHDLAPGTFRLRLEWAEGHEPRIQATKDLQPAVVRGDRSLSVTLTDPGKFETPDGAPRRYSIGRMLEFSDFADWKDVSSHVHPLFRRAARLGDHPELKSRIAEIAAANPTPRARAAAALALVQQSVRYVYAGMDGGNYVPADAKLTWERRFGDCKGVSALLLAILAELGIAAEPVLVSAEGGETVDGFLASPGAFDHVVVRARIDGEGYWLDATRRGDERMMRNQDVPYRWVLPVTADGAALEEIAPGLPLRPHDLLFLDIDARPGLDQPAHVTTTHVLRGDAAIGLNSALKMMTRDAAIAALKRQFSDGWITPQKVDWKFDPQSAALALTIAGPAELDWEVYDTEQFGQFARLFLPQGGFSPPSKRERPSEQDQNAPWVNSRDAFSCSVTRLKLPELPGSSWDLTARGIDAVVGGNAYYRVANLARNTIEMVRSVRTVKAEISAAEAAEANRRIKDFDNSKAQVQATPIEHTDDATQVLADLPDLDRVDWLGEVSLCKPR